jgi:hypothetical protein
MQVCHMAIHTVEGADAVLAALGLAALLAPVALREPALPPLATLLALGARSPQHLRLGGTPIITAMAS